MPQMAPTWWMLMMMLLSTLTLITSTMIFFNFNKIKKFKNKMLMNNLTWKW